MNLREIYASKGYKYYDESKDWNINIFGIRSGGIPVDNKFDDVIGIEYYVNGKIQVLTCAGTTQPGIYYMNHPMNTLGSGIVVPGQYKGVYQIGLHLNKYEALVQRGIIKVYRDNDKDSEYDLDPVTITEGDGYGINIHHASATGTSMQIDNWSAGCQVISSIDYWNEFMSIVRKSAQLYGNKFTYTLFNECDIIN